MCSDERPSSANGAIALRASGAAAWSTPSRSVLSDWTMRGPPLTRPSYGRPRTGLPADRTGLSLDPGSAGRRGLLAGAERGDVGPRGAPVRAVAAGLVGRGVDEDVVAPGLGADAEAGRAEVAHQGG